VSSQPVLRGPGEHPTDASTPPKEDVVEELELQPVVAGSTKVRGGDTPLTSPAGGGGGRQDRAARHPSARPVPVLGLGPGKPPLTTDSSFADGPGRADTRYKSDAELTLASKN
jgi:hypothetical protein